jgi:flagellar hook-associated protein 1 FlgK
MSTLGGLLELSRNALLADQAALSATANNVANQNTVGYTTQTATFTSNDTVDLQSAGGGTGSPSVTIASVRDRVLEQRIQQQTQQQSASSAEADVLTQVEAVFSLSGATSTPGATQLGSAIDGFFSSLTALAANPSSAPTQQAAVAAASAVGAAFQSAATGLASIASGLNQSLSTSVTAVNALTKTIAQLDGEIAQGGSTQDAGTLEDQRQTAIAQLSQLIGVNQVRTEGNGLTLTTTGGSVLVSGSTAYALSTTQSGAVTRIFDRTGIDVTAGLTGGSIGGQLAAQITDLPAVSSALDALAYRIGTVVNTQNVLGLTSAGATGSAVFSVPTTSTGAAARLSVIPGATFATAGSGEGSTGSTNAGLLAVLSSARDTSQQTISGSLSDFLGGIGNTSAALASQATVQQASLTQLTSQRDALSAVNLDQQASDLTNYQRSYQAAAQVLAIVNQLMAAAINLGTQTAVS